MERVDSEPDDKHAFQKIAAVLAARHSIHPSDVPASDNKLTLYESTPSEKIHIRSESFFFFAIGDFGEPTEQIVKTAEVMGSWENKPHFVVGLGDNFYPSGVMHADDPQFKTHWEEIFIRKYPSLQVPWFNALGNHDYRGDPMAQVAFTNSASNPMGIWKLPAMNYSFSVKFGGADRILSTNSNSAIEFFELDTNGVQLSVCATHPQLGQLLAQFIQHLDHKLSESQAKWKIVYGHHPLFTQGISHGITGRALGLHTYCDKYGVEGPGYGLEDILVNHGVDAYIAGHEHKMQYNYSRGVHHFLAGAAGHENRFYGGRDPGTCLSWVDEHSTNGFLQVEVAESQLKFQFISNEKALLKEVLVEK